MKSSNTGKCSELCWVIAHLSGSEKAIGARAHAFSRVYRFEVALLAVFSSFFCNEAACAVSIAWRSSVGSLHSPKSNHLKSKQNYHMCKNMLKSSFQRT